MRRRHSRLGRGLQLAAGSIAASFLAYTYVVSEPERLLDADNCPAEPVATTLVAFDGTDPPPRQSKQDVRRRILKLAAALPAGHRLLLHRIGADPEESAAPLPLPSLPRGFRRCAPKNPAGFNRMIEQDDDLKQAFERLFLAPLRAALPHLLTDAPAPQTPLLESLEVMLWSPYLRPEIPSRSLVVFSDWMQNTRTLSHLKGALPSPCAFLRSPLGQRLKGHDWSGLRVVLEYMRNPRDAIRQTAAHRAWWATVFYLLGAEVVILDGQRAASPPAGLCTDTVAVSKPAGER